MSEPEGDPENEAEAEPEIGEAGARLAAALRDAVLHLRGLEMIEIEDRAVDAVVAQCAFAGLDARTPKHMTRRVVHTLLESDQVDEVYGSDDELAAELRRFLGG
jgi:hypothetical protein